MVVIVVLVVLVVLVIFWKSPAIFILIRKDPFAFPKPHYFINHKYNKYYPYHNLMKVAAAANLRRFSGMGNGFLAGNRKSMDGKMYRLLLLVQGGYTTITALWGLVDKDSFMAVTGPKNDIWLLKTVSVLLLVIGFCLLLAARERRFLPTMALLGGGTALGLAAIDLYWALREVISPVYLADAVAEVLFVLVWLGLAIRFSRRKRTGPGHVSS